MLQELTEQLKARLDGLEARERLALAGLGAFLLLLLFYLAIWSPLHGYVERSRAAHDSSLALLQYFRATEQEARAQQAGGAPTQPLLSEVSRAAQAQGLAPSRIQPEGRDAVSVWYDQVPFTRLMQWLEQLESAKGISVRQITLERHGAPGQVSARLVLRR